MSAELRQPRYAAGDLVMLDGDRLREVVQAWPARKPPAPGDDDGRSGNVGRWPSYTLRPPGQPVSWENAAWEMRLRPAPPAASYQTLLVLEDEEPHDLTEDDL